MTSVVMTEEEMRKAYQIGVSRTTENAGRNDIPEYRQEAFKLTSKQANCVGALAELATLKLIGAPMDDEDVYIGYVPTHQYYKLQGRPDIRWNGMDIEVRRADKRYSKIPVRKKDTGYVVVQPFVRYGFKDDGLINVQREVEFLGWCNWDDAMEKPWWSNGTSMVAVDKRPMSTFGGVLIDA